MLKEMRHPNCRNQPSRGTWKTSDGWIEFQKGAVSLGSYRDAHFCIPCFLFPAPKCMAGSTTSWCFTVHGSKASWTHWAPLWILPDPWSSDKESGLSIFRFQVLDDTSSFCDIGSHIHSLNLCCFS